MDDSHSSASNHQNNNNGVLDDSHKRASNSAAMDESEKRLFGSTRMSDTQGPGRGFSFSNMSSIGFSSPSMSLRTNNGQRGDGPLSKQGFSISNMSKNMGLPSMSMHSVMSDTSGLTSASSRLSNMKVPNIPSSVNLPNVNLPNMPNVALPTTSIHRAISGGNSTHAAKKALGEQPTMFQALKDEVLNTDRRNFFEKEDSFKKPRPSFFQHPNNHKKLCMEDISESEAAGEDGDLEEGGMVDPNKATEETEGGASNLHRGPHRPSLMEQPSPLSRRARPSIFQMSSLGESLSNFFEETIRETHHGEDEEVIKAKLSRAKAFHRAVRKSKYKKKAMGLVTSPATKTIRQYRKLKKYFKNHRHELRAPIFLVLWVCWLMAGTLFYGLAPHSNLGLPRGFYMALNIGYSIGFGYPSEDSNSYLFFSTCYVLCGASFVGAALGFFAEKVSKDNEDWFSRLEQKKEVEDALRDNKNIVRGKIKAWLFHYAPAVRALSVWLVFVVSMITYSTIVVKWGLREALYFAISTLSTGGHWSIPNDSQDWLFGLTGGFIMFGVPMTAVAMAQIAYVFISNVDIDEAKAAINEVVTREEIEYLRDLGMQTLTDDDEFDGLVDRAEFIILCMVRMGTDPGLISYINERYMELGFYTGEPLRVKEITQGQHIFVDGKIRRRQSIKNTPQSDVEIYSEFEANLMSLRQQDYADHDDDESIMYNRQPVVETTSASTATVSNNDSSNVGGGAVFISRATHKNRQTSILRRPSVSNHRRYSRRSIPLWDNNDNNDRIKSTRMSAVSFADDDHNSGRTSTLSRMSGVSFYDDSFCFRNSSRMSGVSFHDDGFGNNNSTSRLSGVSFCNDDSYGSRSSTTRRLSVSSHDSSIAGNSEEFLIPSNTRMMPQFGSNVYSRGQLWSIDDKSVQSDLESSSSSKELPAARNDNDNDNDDDSITEKMNTVAIKVDLELLPLERHDDDISTTNLKTVTKVDLESPQSYDSSSIETMNASIKEIDLVAMAGCDNNNASIHLMSIKAKGDLVSSNGGSEEDALSISSKRKETTEDPIVKQGSTDSSFLRGLVASCGSEDAQSITSKGRDTEAFDSNNETQTIIPFGKGKETAEAPIVKRGSTDSSFLRGLLAKFRLNESSASNQDTGSNVTSSSYTTPEDEIIEPMTTSFSAFHPVVINNLQKECATIPHGLWQTSRSCGGGDIEEQMLDDPSPVVVRSADQSKRESGNQFNTREEREDFSHRPSSLDINTPPPIDQNGPAKLTSGTADTSEHHVCQSKFMDPENATNTGDQKDLKKPATNKETLTLQPPLLPFIRDTHPVSKEISQPSNEDQHKHNNIMHQSVLPSPKSRTKLPVRTSILGSTESHYCPWENNMSQPRKVPQKMNYAKYLYTPSG